MVLWLAEKFLAEGKRVAILSRGYRGSGGTSDEIELLKHRLKIESFLVSEKIDLLPPAARIAAPSRHFSTR